MYFMDHLNAHHVAKSHVLAQILYEAIRLIINLTTALNPRCLDSD